MSRRPLAVLALAIASLGFVACSDASVTSPTSSRVAPSSAHRTTSGDSIPSSTCISGYVQADGRCI